MIGFHVPQRTWVVIVLILLRVSPASAENTTQRPATMGDIVLYMNENKNLPEYCQCRLAEAVFREQFRNTEQPNQMDWPVPFANLLAKWNKIIGANNWVHLHHYCFGIRSFNQSLSMFSESEKERITKSETLKEALGGFKYMEERADSTFPLWSQLYLYEFRVYSQLGQPLMAQRALQRAAQSQKKSGAGR